MARGKKKETLTPEDRLQAALVPESEQPYKVPENWCWVKVGDLMYDFEAGTCRTKRNVFTEWKYVLCKV